MADAYDSRADILQHILGFTARMLGAFTPDVCVNNFAVAERKPG